MFDRAATVRVNGLRAGHASVRHMQSALNGEDGYANRPLCLSDM